MFFSTFTNICSVHLFSFFFLFKNDSVNTDAKHPKGLITSLFSVCVLCSVIVDFLRIIYFLQAFADSSLISLPKHLILIIIIVVLQLTTVESFKNNLTVTLECDGKISFICFQCCQ